MPFLATPTDEQREEFVNLLRAGNYIRTACGFCGIAERSFYDWMREGQREDGREWVKQFASEVEHARAFAQASSLQIVQRAAREGTWQAAAWFLERSNPQQWALVQRHEVDMTVSSIEHRSPRERLTEVLDVLSVELVEEDGVILELPMPVEDPHGNGTNGD